MKLEQLSPSAAEAVVSAFSRSRLLDGAPYGSSPRHALALAEVLAASGAPGAEAVLAADARGPRGLAVLRPSAWDTEHFGFAVGRLEHLVAADAAAAAQLVDWAETRCADLGLRFCSTVLPAEDLDATHALEACGWRYQETRMHPWRTLADFPPAPSARFREAGEPDAEAISALASRVFTADRFHNDPGFTKEAADGVYARWALDWFARGGADDRAFVLDEGGRIEGFFLVRIVRPAGAPAVADLVLTAVDTGLGVRGLGTELWSAALDALRPEAAYCATTISARNTPVVNLYAKLGFRFARTETALHRWFGR